MKLKILLYAILLACALVIVWLSADLTRTKKHLADAEDLIEIQHEMIIRLGEMPAVECSVTFEVKNTAVMGAVKNGDAQLVSEQIASYLKKQILEGDTCISK